MTLLDATLDAIDMIREVVDGIRALPACAEAARELTSVRLENACRFLTHMGYDTESLDRILRGNEIESDYLDKHDFERLELINERDLLQRKLGYLLRPRSHKNEPCQLPRDAHILWAEPDEKPIVESWYGALAHELDEFSNSRDTLWRPVDLTHFEE